MSEHLPNNWVETDFKTVVTYQKGKKPKVLKDEPFVGSAPYLDIKAFEKDVIQRHGDIESSNLIEEDSIGIVWDGARSGWVGIGKYGAVGSTIAILKPTLVDSYYTYRFLQSKFDYLNTNTRGTGIPHVDPQILWKIQFPLPPLPEQKRIVAKLDGLFAHLEEVKTRLDKVPQLLKDFEESTLFQAISGKLTQDWRIINNADTWTTKSLEKIADVIDPNPKHRNPRYFEEGFLFLSTAQFGENDGWNLKTAKYVAEDTILEQEKRCHFNNKSIAFSRKGTIGETRILPNTFRFALLDSVCVINPSDQIDHKFLNWSIRSQIVRNQVSNLTRGVALKQISLGAVRSLQIPVPSLEEQKVIGDIIDAVFKKSNALNEKFKAIKQNINNLPKTILTKAFNGELVEQLPTDGDARNLLKDIEALKAEVKPKKSNKK
jgi:type I restriction enzyme S subunit